MGRILPILVVNKNKVYLLHGDVVLLSYNKDNHKSVFSPRDGGWSIFYYDHLGVKIVSKELNTNWYIRVDKSGVWDLKKHLTKERLDLYACLFICFICVFVPCLMILFSNNDKKIMSPCGNGTCGGDKGPKGDPSPPGHPSPWAAPCPKGDQGPAGFDNPPWGVRVFHRGHVFDNPAGLDAQEKLLLICGCRVCIQDQGSQPVAISELKGEFEFCINPVLEFQPDGNLVLYDVYDRFRPDSVNIREKMKTPLWATGTDNKGYTKMYYYNNKFHFL